MRPLPSRAPIKPLMMLVALAASAVPAVAQFADPRPIVPQRRAQPSAPAPQAPAVRCDPARTLGVARIAEIDTTSGPRFGHQQYKDHALLQDGEIVLTFDDGPLRATTQAVVDALEAQCTKGTFFMVGSQAIADPDMVRQIQRKGHTVANHTWSHADLRKMTPLKARQEIELGFSAVTLAAGQPIAPFFRFPFLADTTAMKEMAATRSYGIFSIEIDALDYRNKQDPEAVHAEVLKQLGYYRKGILLFHDIHPSTAQAMPSLLAAIKAKGFKVVHLKPVAGMQTLPEFDAIARKEFAAKRGQVAANPLAPRAVTFPLPSRETLPQAATAPPPPPPQAAPPPLPPPLPRVTRPLPPRDDWRRSVFGN